MRRSDWEDRCKRHPEHRLSKGVCPSCLRDRLAHLSASSSATTTLTRASSSATSTSPYSSNGSPPLHHAALSADASSVHVVGGGSFVNVSAFSQPLMPTSRKPAAARQEEASRETGKGEKKKKKSSSSKKKIGRFLSRLVGTEKRRRTGDGGDGGELFHSSTMKEKTSTRWVFF
ncbi:uncharacterized protein LOC100821440 [Brachypodium distachyon]|uniref:Uncharacterized protein n=1 Tax=Brachypodium distachyon TaxID=15368 RepID=I1H8S3_BRADI|nr:uncharacterized protein LOC100821440 [Brachypodium distachyon]KQK23206.1 hypothetical protein BRADI_1g71920v3 [Brachypodium distachyon]|eukprot:XP_003558623.1 uncharacterized protein LOC100821440 [Brachypodium distachyon]